MHPLALPTATSQVFWNLLYGDGLTMETVALDIRNSHPLRYLKLCVTFWIAVRIICDTFCVVTTHYPHVWLWIKLRRPKLIIQLMPV